MTLYRYLTRSYVEALELSLIPVIQRRNEGVGFRSEDETLPRPAPLRIVEGVKLDAYLYIREPDGLAYSRTP